jgi:hypothetical protein
MKTILLFALFGVVTAMILPARALAVTTWYVDGTLGNDTPTCGTAPGSSACKTIQFTINKASSNDTIVVAAGLYPEPTASGPLTINKTLTLLGAQAGIDARTRVGAESVVTDASGTSVAASNVIIDGLTFQNSVNQAFTGFGIWINPGKSGTQIVNNIIQNNIVGIGLANLGSRALIEHNRIEANNQGGGASGTGIYTDQFVGGPRVENVLILENAFIGNADAGIDVSNTDASGGAFNLEVSTNTFDSNGRAVLFFNTHDSTIHDNSVPNTTLLGSAAIRLFDNNTNDVFLNNDLKSGVGHAIRFSFLGRVGGPSSGVVFHENNIGTLGPASFTLDGLLVDPSSTAETVNAKCNWWGSPTGPTNAGNPGGTGEEVVGNADFTPWLVAPEPGGLCLGGTAPTPGKVTGGGQIDGDPLFSPLGDLISVPAVIPNLSDPTAQDTFGFVVNCCPATGNLEYDDHQMNVRIKATSISNLFITNGQCGPDTHATFTGKADVIRPTGTTNQDFTVNVDDCGEPGTNDTFQIQTFGTPPYSSGPPTTLVGGNIQIHKS